MGRVINNDEEDEILFEHHSYSEGSATFDCLLDDTEKDNEDYDETSVGLNEFGPQPAPVETTAVAGAESKSSPRDSRRSSIASRSSLSLASSKQSSQRPQQKLSSPSSVSSKKLQAQQLQKHRPHHHVGDMGKVVESGLLVPSSAEPTTATPKGKAPSAAFLKRKSAFTGEDLLSQEAESFVEFLEETGASDISRIEVLDNSSDGMATTASQDRFLSAVSAANMDAEEEDDDDFPSLSTTNDSKINRDVLVSIVDRSSGTKSPFLRPISALSALTTSIRSTSQTSRSSALASKSLSYDTTVSHTSTHHTSDDFYHSAKAPISHSPYCGGIVFSSAEDDDYTSDHSEDYSSAYSKKTKGKSALEEIQLDVLDAVQELARSASSNMMKFLQN